MEKQTDDQVAVPIVEETKQRFPLWSSCSFDKGFHSPDRHHFDRRFEKNSTFLSGTTY
jgi:hypothetical protein